MSKSYYPCWFRFNGADAYFIWYTHERSGQFEHDGVLLNEQGNFLVFKSLADLKAYAERQSLVLNEDGDLVLDLLHKGSILV